jgi:hypothetical protein
MWFCKAQGLYRYLVTQDYLEIISTPYSILHTRTKDPDDYLGRDAFRVRLLEYDVPSIS